MLNKSQRIVVTGGKGFLGSFVMEQLRLRGYKHASAISKDEFNLTEQSQVRRLLAELKPAIVIHLAAQVGGIGANMQAPGEFIYNNLLMGTMLMEEARKSQVKKMVSVGTVCSYPANTPTPFREESLWEGFPEKTNAPYGIAKRTLIMQGQAYRQQYGFNSVFVIPTNLYGPGDNFDLQTSHVIPALIVKFLKAIDAKQNQVTLWGTGTASRDFIYVEDCARALVDAMEKYDDSEPINLGSGQEIRISELALMIAGLTGFTGEIRWDSSKPDGQRRRVLDIQRARKAIDFSPRVGFETGLRQTIEWYISKYHVRG